MQSLNIADAGFGYIIKCIGLYYEGNVYFILYLISIAFLSVFGESGIKGKPLPAAMKEPSAVRLREIFLPQFVFMALTVYNPLFPVALNTFFDVNKEYYRFLWMAPIIICIAAAGSIIVFEYAGSSRIRRAASALLIICILVSGGTFLYKDGYIPSPTIYHMPTEIPEVSRLIHEDADEEYPRAMFEYDYNMMIRQYDASILLACDREAYMEAMGGGVTYESAMEEGNYIHRLLAVVGLGIRIPGDYLRSALENTHTEYVVVTNASGNVDYLKGAGLTVVGETANHTILHYEPKEREDFELPDYSEVWRLTPQVYDFLL